jgi:hypothetical protein
MVKASRTVLDGFELSSDAHITRYPDRNRDSGGRGDEMWKQVMELIAKELQNARSV